MVGTAQEGIFVMLACRPLDPGGFCCCPFNHPNYQNPAVAAAGRDQGINVRQRAGTLVTLVTDRDKLNEERDKVSLVA